MKTPKIYLPVLVAGALLLGANFLGSSAVDSGTLPQDRQGDGYADVVGLSVLTTKWVRPPDDLPGVYDRANVILARYGQ